MNEFYEKAIERLRDDKGLSGNKETAMAPAVREALEKFCEDDGEFAQAARERREVRLREKLNTNYGNEPTVVVRYGK